jgi:AraC-like DNA-binding protein
LDPVSQILATVKLNGALYFNAEFAAPWCVTSPPSAELAPALSPGAPHLLIYHYVLAGRAFAQTAGHPPLSLEPGDVVAFPHGDAHRLSSSPSLREPSHNPAVLQKILARDLSLLRAGGAGDTVRLVCGYMACDPLLSRPVLASLPPIFKVNLHAAPSARWLEDAILHLVDEAAVGGLGSQAMLAKLSEALFVDLLRRFILSLPGQHTGWLAAARDPAVGKSLSLLHTRLDHPWTIAELAAHVGLSRSALVERFTRYLGEPPIAYLTRFRLQLAARDLASSSRSVADIAAAVGYESEPAFHRAFKRLFHLPPARYRRQQRETHPSQPNS